MSSASASRSTLFFVSGETLKLAGTRSGPATVLLFPSPDGHRRSARAVLRAARRLSTQTSTRLRLTALQHSVMLCVCARPCIVKGNGPARKEPTNDCECGLEDQRRSCGERRSDLHQPTEI